MEDTKRRKQATVLLLPPQLLSKAAPLLLFRLSSLTLPNPAWTIYAEKPKLASSL